MKNGYVKNIMKLFDDEVEKIRENAYKILLNLSEFQSGKFLNDYIKRN